MKFVKTAAARDHIRATLRAKDQFALRHRKPTHCLVKIVVEDRVGLIHDISTVTAQNHMNILSFHTDNPKGSRFPIDRLEVQSTEVPKIEKLIVKLKRVQGVRQVGYKLV